MLVAKPLALLTLAPWMTWQLLFVFMLIKKAIQALPVLFVVAVVFMATIWQWQCGSNRTAASFCCQMAS